MLIDLHEGKLHIRFRVNEDSTVELVNFSALENTADLPYRGAQPEAATPRWFP